MNQEIERKFIVDPSNQTLRDLLSEKTHKLENRFYLYRGDGIELRFTSVNPTDGETYYDFDRMQVVGDSLANRSKERIKITKQEFDELTSLVKLRDPNIKPIIRKSYLISQNPQIEVKVYGGEFEGLVRAEVEFSSVEESNSYKPLNWFGKELTNSPVGNDVKLPDLSPEDFKKTLARYLEE